ncbi:Hypothetical protein D9617_3g020710 [Elsinoe fawcettii]|nr:Hypothetical protein D9617_3g020710 [Elsinoe fawcettii]
MVASTYVRSPQFRLRFLAVCLFFLVTLYLANGTFSLKTVSDDSGGSSVRFSRVAGWMSAPLKSSLDDHPVQRLHATAVRRFEDMIQRQSKTLAQAIDEYERRYNRPPPPGFDKWFHAAHAVNSPIIDDFDIILEQLDKFSSVSPEDLKKLIEQAEADSYMDTFIIKDGKAIHQEEDEASAERARILADFLPNIPDMKLLINPLDEPRVLFNDTNPTSPLQWYDLSEKSSWDHITSPCPAINSPTSDTERGLDGDLPFITDKMPARDICSHPEYETMHGFCIRPETLITTGSPALILSQSAPSTFSDQLWPAMYYYTNNNSDLDTLDTAWNQKINKLYWAGSTTGGHNQDDPLTRSHRERLVRLTNSHDPRAHLYLSHTSPNTWSPVLNYTVHPTLYNTKFTTVTQCSEPTCSRLRQTYHVPDDAHRDPLPLALRHKLLLDLDGNAFSGRYYTYLASGSCVLKMTIFREWHDERLVPWTHYIPISVGMEELPEVVRFLTLTSAGEEIARRVADMGREWHGRLLREEDAAVYMYRFLLEYARLLGRGA